MPKMDGYEATQLIRKYEEEIQGTHLPIVRCQQMHLLKK